MAGWWISPHRANNRKYRKIRQSINKWPSSYCSNSRDEKVLCRLRIGHSQLTHSFIMESSNPPVCDHCQEQLTVEHILVQCPVHNSFRNKYHLDGKDMKYLLSDEGPIDDVMKFLKETNFYYKF